MSKSRSMLKEMDETNKKYKEKDLIKIGFWKNDESENAKYPDIKGFIDNTMSKELKHKMLAYLKKGKYWAAYLGSSTCRVCERWDNGCSEFTDGKYLWPEGLPHYIEEHNVRIPELEAIVNESHKG